MVPAALVGVGLMPRIVSLISSATEIVAALGFEADLVGRSHECDFPPSVLRLPVCTAPKFDIHGSSAEIDRDVKRLLQDATSVYRVDAELLRELRPDVIVTQSQCEVCAVSLKDVEQAVCDWTGGRARVVSLQPNALADVWADIRRVADALDASDRGVSLIAELQARMDAVARRVADLPRPTVACLEWIDPLMAAGNWVPELVERAGGVNLFGTAGKHSPWMTWEQLCERDPEVIVALPCGFDLARTRQEMRTLAAKPEWPRLQAVRTGRVAVTDGNQFFNRPGPRLVESLEILAEVLHPETFQFGHRGTGWELNAG
jgi:iron complex transport system substrate-binding protein